MLSVHNLRVEYGARVLFSDLTFSIMPRERIAFAGHNGAGKSTLMKAIAGIIETSGGSHTPNDLFDQRDKLLADLSQYTQLSVVPGEGGTAGAWKPSRSSDPKKRSSPS